MRFLRRWMAPGVAVALSVLAACSDGDVKAVGPVPTAASTTTAPASITTPTTVAPTTTTRQPAATTTTTAAPVFVDGIPQVTATPPRGPVGTRVRIEGTGFTEAMWKGESPLWLTTQVHCGALYAQAEHTVSVSAGGRLTGEFVVPTTGHCRQSDVDGLPVRGGTFRIVFACTPCTIGQFEVTGTASECNIVAFTPNSDDVASGILAFNMGCPEAERLVRRADASVGRTPVEVDGFRCILIGENDRTLGLASSTFECTSGSSKVLWVRT